MNYFGKIFTAAAALVLCCTNIFAQEQNPADTAASGKPAFPEDAPILRQDGAQKLYYIRDVNIHGVQYLNPDILKSSAGLIPGDSIYLPSNFIANAISRLWSQRFFSDVKIGAEIEGDSLDLEVFLKERPRVNNWDFEGISKGKKKDLLEKLKLKRGSELSDYVIDKNQKLIKAYWSEKGFRNTEVSTRITNDTLRPQMVNVTFLIDRKHQVKIGKINFTGNQRVDDEVIRRELYTRPGELYDRSLLMQTIRTLGSLGHFNPEAIMPDIKPVSNELVNVNWPLEEQASDQFNIAGGWGSGTFVGSVGITLNNLSIKNFFKKGAWRPYPMGQNQRLSLSAQTNGTYYKAFALSFTDPWLGGKKPNSFTISAHFSEQNNAYYVWQKSTQYFRTYGLAAGLGKRLNWPDPYFTLYGEASYERFSLKNWNTFGMTNGAANLLSLKFVFARNSVDQPIYPRRGSEFSASVQFTPPYSLWDGKDYKKLAELANSTDSNVADKANQERYRWVEFHKWQFKAQWFQALTKNSNLVLMLKAEMGYLGNYNKYKVSPFERFEVGGDGMSGYNIYGIDIISMRGYEDGALDPTSDYSVAYNKYTAEIRYPVILKPSSQIYVLGFLEGGNAFESWKKFSPFKIKRSAGFGVRLYLPVVGMLGIDWGYGFDSPAGQSGKSGSQFHFVMGQQF